MEFVASFSKDSWFLVEEESRFMQRNALLRNKGNHKLVREEGEFKAHKGNKEKEKR
jgi:hypothetical protein